MTDEGQHVGGVSDRIVEDEARSAARAQQEALKKLARPVERNRGPRHDIGDGDPCPNPINESCGKMFTIQGTRMQNCPNQAHDGQWPTEGQRTPPSRHIWPMDNLTEAVTAYNERLSQEG